MARNILGFWEYNSKLRGRERALVREVNVEGGQVPLGAFSHIDHLSSCDHDDGDDVGLCLDSALSAPSKPFVLPIRLLSNDV